MKNWSTEQGCCCCGVSGQGMTCLHHAYTRKARPDLQMKPFNLIPLCQAHHNEVHAKGTTWMAIKYSGFQKWLNDNGWEFDHNVGKWRHPRADFGND